MSDDDVVLALGWELADIVAAGTPGGLQPHRAATAAVEEVGECIGAHNKIVDGRVATTDHFRTEWAQAVLMLVMLGRQHLDRTEMRDALHDEMASQRTRWADRVPGLTPPDR